MPDNKPYLRKFLFAIVIAVFMLSAIGGYAEESRDYASEFNEMDLDELQNMQQVLSEIINDKKLAGATIQFEEEMTVAIKKQLNLSVSASGREITPKTKITYESSDPGVAKITGSKLTGVSDGKAIIKATAVFEDEAVLETQAKVTVVVPVAAIKIPQTFTVFAGKSADFREQIVISPQNASDKGLLFSVDDETIASADDKGIIHGIKGGTVTLTVTSSEKTQKPKTAKCKINVTEAVSGISLDSETITVGKQKKFTIKANVMPESATNKKLVWTSDNPKIATVSSAGIITGVKTGKTTITCTAADGSGVNAKCEVTVVQSVSGIKLDKNNLTLGKGKTYKLTATISPKDATNKNVTWKTSSASVAQVDKNGTITAKGGGDCEISCTTQDGGKTAKVKVHVPTFSVDKTEYKVTSKNGTTIPINWDSYGTELMLTDNGGSYFDAEWDSSSNIKIIPKKAGKGTIIIYNKKAPKDKVKVSITIDHSAAYDKVSYPSIQYDSASRYPGSYKGDKCSFSGKVLQVMSGVSTTSYRISSRGNYNNVVYVTIKNSDITTPIIEDDKVTVYGKYNDNYTYTSIFGASITLPSVSAERIFVK
ncbi:MAG: Ig-like domain-containing protein [Christensenellales bacterium]